jgi:hypothetical protein
MLLMLNRYWFRRLYTSDFIMTIDYYAKSLRGKVLPAFDDISEEASKVEDEAYHRLAGFIDPEGFDPADIVDQAHDAGISFYMMAEGVVQGIVNMFTAGLYHLFEQQLLRLHRQELLFGSEENNPQLLTVKEARYRLRRDYEIDISAFASWSKLEELSHAANAVKHADGGSCTKLKRIRPDLFRHPSLKDDADPPVPWTVHRQVYLPLAGEDLYISLDDFTKSIHMTLVHIGCRKP